MGQVLAHAAPQRERLGGGGADMGRIGVVDDLMAHPIEQPVQKRRATSVVPAWRAVAGELDDRRIGARQRGLAQIEARRKALHRAADDAVGRLGLHFAFDAGREAARERSVGREGVHDIAEGVLVLVEPAILRNVDPPVR